MTNSNRTDAHKYRLKQAAELLESRPRTVRVKVTKHEIPIPEIEVVDTPMGRVARPIKARDIESE